MAGYQFIHVECYARVGSKKGGSKWGIRDILAEANREPGNYYHVKNAQKPTLLMGTIEGVEEAANHWADNTKDAKGRKLRKDGLCMMAGVISLARDQEKDWPRFRDESIEWLKGKYGERLKAVVEHKDETHPHIHFYIVPKIGEKFDDIHAGKKAAADAKAKGKLKGEQNKEYCEAMRLWQDNFSAKVASKYGLARIGPGRRRLSREQWKAEQKQAEILKNVKANARKYVNHYKRKAAERWEVLRLVDKLKMAWHLPSKKVQEKAKAEQEMRAKAEGEAVRLRKENSKLEADVERNITSGVSHARAAREARAKVKAQGKEIKRLEAENQALKAQVVKLNAPKPTPTFRQQHRKGLAV
ncbi:plasmid recombination protein [Castellaniella sp.]|uniref:plasmid recombination protein n=1 Tax=Castellaniella sp. TaxID=1955812 RepID=UPI002AFF02E2|nr:plasmid recombination protein [Castellaniella sp.]